MCGVNNAQLTHIKESRDFIKRETIRGIKRNMKTTKEKTIEIAQLMQDFKGDNVVALDVSQLNSWTDYFVIVTVNSATHSKGLFKHIKDYIKQNDLEIMKPKQKIPDGYDWNLIDLGVIVIHLMSEDARGFYNLEKLWQLAEKVF